MKRTLFWRLRRNRDISMAILCRPGREMGVWERAILALFRPFPWLLRAGPVSPSSKSDI